MATPYRNRTTPVRNVPNKASSSWFSRHKAFVIISMLIVAFIAWFNSDYWPWPSKERIRERLDKVIETCTDRENSSDCKNIQKRYGMTFRYCHSIGDFNKTTTVYGSDGKSFQMPYFPWYAVAWEGNSSEPPKNETRLPNGTTLPGISTYYGCKEHKE